MLIKLLDKLLKACGRNGFYPLQPRQPLRHQLSPAEEIALQQLARLDEVQAMESQLEAIRNRQTELLRQAQLPTISEDKRSRLQLQAATLETRAVKLNNKIKNLWEDIDNDF